MYYGNRRCPEKISSRWLNSMIPSARLLRRFTYGRAARVHVCTTFDLPPEPPPPSPRREFHARTYFRVVCTFGASIKLTPSHDRRVPLGVAYLRVVTRVSVSPRDTGTDATLFWLIATNSGPRHTSLPATSNTLADTCPILSPCFLLQIATACWVCLPCSVDDVLAGFIWGTEIIDRVNAAGVRYGPGESFNTFIIAKIGGCSRNRTGMFSSMNNWKLISTPIAVIRTRKMIKRLQRYFRKRRFCINATLWSSAGACTILIKWI